MASITSHQADIQRARQAGWQTAVYEFQLEKTRLNEPLLEDLRITDWIYLLPNLSQFKVCIIGPGWGILPVILSGLAKQVTVLDVSQERLDFLNVIKEQENKTNLDFICVTKHWTEHLSSGGPWDLIILRDSIIKDSRPFSLLMNEFKKNLSQDGWISVFAANRFSIQASLSRTPAPQYDYIPLSLGGYRRALKKAGFKNASFFAPLPHFDGTPLMNLPLDKSGALTFFFRNVFPLFEMVSPESKKAYQREYQIAKLGVKIGLKLGLCGLSRFFLSGFGIIAQNDSRKA